MNVVNKMPVLPDNRLAFNALQPSADTGAAFFLTRWDRRGKLIMTLAAVKSAMTLPSEQDHVRVAWRHKGCSSFEICDYLVFVRNSFAVLARAAVRPGEARPLEGSAQSCGGYEDKGDELAVG
jgi:hypothetical protein